MFRLDGEQTGELLLVRHAAPVCADVPALGEPGRIEAERLADALAGRAIEAVYTSPAAVALQTAEIVGGTIDRAPVKVAGLRDIEYQPGLDDAELIRCFEVRPAELFARRPRWDSLPGFEESKAFRLRAIQALEAIVARHSARRVVVVTHASVINAYLSMVLDVPRDMFFAPDYASIASLRVCEGEYALRRLNDTSHLRTVV
jgi:probable phosphoglycerate mutase